MQEDIKKIESQALGEINNAKDYRRLDELRIKYLGRKSQINQLFSKIPQLTQEERAGLGRRLNSLKEAVSKAIEDKMKDFTAKDKAIDVTLPADEIYFGRKHILSAVSERICNIFEKIGFVVVEGTETEDEWHNFSALNIPLEHPSREAFDTFYLDISARNSKSGKYLLRSHTSPSQIRVMEKTKPPFAVISPGRVYRPDKVDASHSFMFHQVEGFCVDEGIKFSHLKGVLLHFAKNFFGNDVSLRFRPHFFPFTEPSAEVDISCMICKGAGCSVCSRKGWLEILGCGMIHPNVLKACRINPSKYSGFAFGMGVERITMLKYGINDIRLFYENDIRFLTQFYE
ncbi:MAG: phenylalanine--tRNA ligase subunit alpha [Candidatus Omnitrophica bacterium 4484_171]|nr:MAG: phenylalanine--tRNA ligase subunit alpha [Candidatus Omnitrophica bacterium 4484_171]